MELYLNNPDVWYILGETPEFIVKELDELYKSVIKSPEEFTDAKKTLAGVIDGSYNVNHSSEFNEFIRDTITPNLDKINNNSTTLKYSNSLDLKSQVHWINIQKKGDYNPIHSHSGQYSYVFWHKIPFNFEEENKVSELKNTSFNRNLGDFVFNYVDMNTTYSTQLRMNSLQKQRTYLFHIPMGIDNTRENYFCIFPAWLPHSVDPFFSSDENRVTFSGNYEQTSDLNVKQDSSLL